MVESTRRFNRRQFLRFGGGVVGASVLSLKAVKDFAAMTDYFEQQMRLRDAEINLDAVDEDLRPYEFVQLPDPVTGKEITMPVYKKAGEGKARVGLSDGAIPSVRILDSRGCSIHGSENPDLLSGSLENPNKFVDAELIRLSVARVKPNSEPLAYKGRTIRTLGVIADSWGSYGGGLYSIPKFLQDLFAVEGYGVNVASVCAPGYSLAHYATVREKYGNLFDHTLVFIHPQTDLITDSYADENIGRDISMPVGNEVRSDAAKLAALGSIERYAEAYFPPAQLARLIQRQRKRDTDPGFKGFDLARLTDDPKVLTNWVNKAGLYAPHLGGSDVFFMPTGLTELETLKYMAVFPEIKKPFEDGKREVGQLALDGTNVDYTGHPNPSGALGMAAQIFKSLTGREPSGGTFETISRSFSDLAGVYEQGFYKRLLAEGNPL
jgi:hypothetical protein